MAQTSRNGGQGVPTWAWWVGGAALLTGAAVLLFRSSSAAASPLQPGERRILVLGDSISNGYYPKLEKLLSTDQLIDGTYGGKQTPYITQKGLELLAQQPTHVVVMGGINDISSGRTPADIYATLSSFWRAAHAAGAKVVALTLTPCGSYPKCKAGTTFANQRVELNGMIRNAANGADGVDAVIDTESLGDGDALLPENSSGGLHLSGTGCQNLAQLVANGLP